MHRLLPSDPPSNGNFVELVLRHCKMQPWVTALHIPRWADRRGLLDFDELSFGQFGQLICLARAALRAHDVQAQDRVVVLHKPSAHMYAVVLALLAEGMVPVFIDTGMKPKAMLRAFQSAAPKLVVTAPSLVRLHWLIPGARRCAWLALEQLFDASAGVNGATYPIQPHMHGLISYTSGTTGHPKGADRTHESLIQQHRAIRQEWPDRADDIDMTSLPVVVLHNLCCGMPTVLPILKFSAPGRVDGELVLAQIRRHQVTRLSGAPAFMEGLARGVLAGGQPVPSIRDLRVGGAPVGRNLARLLQRAFPTAQVHVVYGSTEAEPIASGSIADLLATEGSGFWVGHMAAQAEIRVCKIPAQIKPQHEADLIPHVVAKGEVGELLVSGSHVLQGYVDNPQATQAIKIPRGNGTVWHRTGDLVRVDEAGVLWLMGRVADQVRVDGRLQPVFGLEAELLALPGVRQVAVVQRQDEQALVLFYALQADWGLPTQVERDIYRCLQQCGWSGVRIKQLPALPVDRRHNSKIDRSALRRRARFLL